MEYSKTEPRVSQGDIIVLEDGVELLVVEIVHGYPYASTCNNYYLPDGPFAMGKQALVEVPYKKKVLSDNWKTLDGNTYRTSIEEGYANRVGADPDEAPDYSSIMVTRKMEIEDIIKVYGGMLSEEALEGLADIVLKSSRNVEEDRKAFAESLLFGYKEGNINLESNVYPQEIGRPIHPSKCFKIVKQPWGSYTLRGDSGFFIPPNRDPYNPNCVEFSGRIGEYSSPLLEEVIALAEKEENKIVYQDKDRDSFVKCGMALDLFMSGHKGFIAGGCFKNIFLGQKIKDVDIFFENMEDWSQAFNHYSKNDDFKFVYQNANAFCFRYIKTGQKVEIIRSRFGKPEDLIREFDFTVAKFAYYKDTSNDITEYRFVYHPDFFEHLVMKKLVMDESCTFPVNTFERTYRYQKYGFSMCRETKQKLIKLLQGANVDDIGSSLYFGFD